MIEYELAKSFKENRVEGVENENKHSKCPYIFQIDVYANNGSKTIKKKTKQNLQQKHYFLLHFEYNSSFCCEFLFNSFFLLLLCMYCTRAIEIQSEISMLKVTINRRIKHFQDD